MPLCGRKGGQNIVATIRTAPLLSAHAGAGDGWALLTGATGKDFKTLAAEVDKLIGRVYSPEERVIKLVARFIWHSLTNASA